MMQCCCGAHPAAAAHISEAAAAASAGKTLNMCVCIMYVCFSIPCQCMHLYEFKIVSLTIMICTFLRLCK